LACAMPRGRTARVALLSVVAAVCLQACLHRLRGSPPNRPVRSHRRPETRRSRCVGLPERLAPMLRWLRRLGQPVSVHHWETPLPVRAPGPPGQVSPRCPPRRLWRAATAFTMMPMNHRRSRRIHLLRQPLLLLQSQAGPPAYRQDSQPARLASAWACLLLSRTRRPDETEPPCPRYSQHRAFHHPRLCLLSPLRRSTTQGTRPMTCVHPRPR